MDSEKQFPGDEPHRIHLNADVEGNEAQLAELERRKAAGEVLSDEEERALDAYHLIEDSQQE